MTSRNMIGRLCGLRQRPHVMVSEVTTANYFLKELLKKENTSG